MSPVQASGHHLPDLWRKHCGMRTRQLQLQCMPTHNGQSNVPNLIPKVVWECDQLQQLSTCMDVRTQPHSQGGLGVHSTLQCQHKCMYHSQGGLGTTGTVANTAHCRLNVHRCAYLALFPKWFGNGAKTIIQPVFPAYVYLKMPAIIIVHNGVGSQNITDTLVLALH